MQDCEVSPYNLLPEVLKEFHLPDDIIIYDSTLRDGEQMPGISFSPEQKLCLAKKLDECNVPEIEVGFPAVSKSEVATIQTIAHEGLKAKLLVLSRLKKEDIDAAIDSDADIILLFIASSPLHLRYKLHLTEEEIKEKVIFAIQYAKDHGLTPSFSTEDSTRTPLPFLEDLVVTAYKTGAKRIGFTDTVGCATPQTIHYLISHMRPLVPLPFSAHLHNDFGLSVINALTALSSGVTHVCTTINGWGERAGNVPLEQLVMTLKILYQKDLGIDTTQLRELSEMVANFVKMPIPKTQPFVGDNIFTHESGIHVAAILENPRTYEPIAPSLVGGNRAFVIGKHSGKRIIRHFCHQNDIRCDETTLAQCTIKIKELVQKEGYISNDKVAKILHDMVEEKDD